MGTEVAKISDGAAKLHRHLPMLDALLGGTSAMRAAGKGMLPKWPKESEEAYTARLKVATLFNAYERTVDVLAARPFSQPMTYSEGADATLWKEWSEDVDLQGTDFDEFASRVLREALGRGFAGILVDSPQKGATVRTRADERAGNIRPYMVMIRADEIIGWRSEVVRGVRTITQLRLREVATEYAGEFGEQDVEQIRVLEPGRWWLYRKNHLHQWEVYREGLTDVDFVPFVPVYGRYRGFMCSAPPLLNVAYLNVEHWQSKSDQQVILHVARVPILTIIGGNDKTTLTVGGSSAVSVPIGGDLKYTEHSGAAISAGAQSLKDLEELMRQSGAELLVVRPGQVTATQIWSENEAGMCTLQRVAMNLQHSLNVVLGYMGKFAGVENIGSVELFTDFGVADLQQADAKLLLEMNVAGKLSDETLFKETQRRGVLSTDLTWDDEKTRIEEQTPEGMGGFFGRPGGEAEGDGGEGEGDGGGARGE